MLVNVHFVDIVINNGFQFDCINAGRLRDGVYLTVAFALLVFVNVVIDGHSRHKTKVTALNVTQDS